MKTLVHKGFTIIEVMLFLAISGVLAATLLGGWTVMINTQRYKDSVDTVYGYFQDQYNLVYNVENERTSSLSCDNDSQVSESVGGSTEHRGQSNCVLMGRFIRVADGSTITSYAVVGNEPIVAPIGSDSQIIKEYKPKVVTQSIGLSEAKQSVPWGAVMRGKAGNSDPLNLDILLLRSPSSGLVHRYIVNSSTDTPSIDMANINDTSEKDDITFCFDPGAIVQGAGQAVVIRAYASSRNSIETLGSDNGC